VGRGRPPVIAAACARLEINDTLSLFTAACASAFSPTYRST